MAHVPVGHGLAAAPIVTELSAPASQAPKSSSVMAAAGKKSGCPNFSSPN
jgi:hypothetical protein